MGVKELRDSFNLVAEPDATVRTALLDYVNQGGTQYQRLTFKGSWLDGTEFETKSDLVRPGGDVIIAARSTATAMLKAKGIER